jgi:hypothetical protein
MLFFAITMVAVTPEDVLGGSSATKVIAARIAFDYDLAGQETCMTQDQDRDDRFLLLIDDPGHAIRYTAAALPSIPISFLNAGQRDDALPVKGDLTVCRHPPNKRRVAPKTR